MPSTAGNVTYFQSNSRRTFKPWWQRTPSGPYQFLNYSRKEVGLLRILPALTGAPEEPLYAKSRIVSLLKEPHYECISYCWGDPENTEMVIFQGKPGIWLWADAPCIDQNDMNERNRQVQLMARIYTDASSVRAWIEWPGSDQTMAPPSPYDVRIGTAWLLEVSLNFFLYGHAIPPVLDGKQLAMLAIMKVLFSDPFWQRIWITQELILASNIVLYYGALKYKLAGKSKFQQLTENMLSYLRPARLGERDFMACEGAAETSADVLERKSTMLGEILSPLYRFFQAELLSRTDHLRNSLNTRFDGIAKAGRKHDYVYAMLGLVPADARIVPDYSKSLQEVYAENTFAVMRAAKDLVCLLGATTGLPSMPTWAVDYSAASSSRILEPLWGVYSAGKHVEFSLQERPPEAIVVNGVLFDAVVFVSASFDVLEQTLSLDRVTAREFIVSQQRKALAFYRAHSATPLESSEIPRELLRILALDVAATMLPVGASCHRRNRLELQDSSVEQHILPRMFSILATQKLFVTAGGRFGTAEKEIQIGDPICVFGGCPMPLCVRPKVADGSTVYKLISPCYVDGVMDGQAPRIRKEQLARDGRDVSEAVEKIILI
ncbi:hypothetical protein LTR95_010980 [Oleoguttula sp. CCFEE 5521]